MTTIQAVAKHLANYAAMYYTKGVNPMPMIRNYCHQNGMNILHWTEIVYGGKHCPSEGIVVHPHFEHNRVRVDISLYEHGGETVVSSETLSV